LNEAIRSGDLLFCEALLEGGSDPNEILSEVDGRTALHLAGQFNSYSIVEAILKSGGRVDEKDKYGNQPMHLAAQSGQWRNIRSLVKEEATLEGRNIYMNTPLHLAAMEGYLDSVRTILDLFCTQGSNVSVVNPEEPGLKIAVTTDHANESTIPNNWDTGMWFNFENSVSMKLTEQVHQNNFLEALNWNRDTVRERAFAPRTPRCKRDYLLIS
jgi:ankyrin repeat protein